METVGRPRFDDPQVAMTFARYGEMVRDRLLYLRRLIYDVAHSTPGVGAVTETLKWGQPAYLTEESKSGTTIRISPTRSGDHYALYVHCQTNLIATFRTLYPELTYEGNRAVVFNVEDALPTAALRSCIALALTYHADRRRTAKKESSPS